MKSKNNDNKQGPLFVKGENFNIKEEGKYLVFKLSSNEQVEEGLEEQPEGEGVLRQFNDLNTKVNLSSTNGATTKKVIIDDKAIQPKSGGGGTSS